MENVFHLPVMHSLSLNVWHTLRDYQMVPFATILFQTNAQPLELINVDQSQIRIYALALYSLVIINATGTQQKQRINALHSNAQTLRTHVDVIPPERIPYADLILADLSAI